MSMQETVLGKLAGVRKLLYTLWLFAESDTSTFVLPNTAFGILGALAGPCLTSQQHPHFAEIFQRLPFVLLFNWSNVFIFDLANQRLPDSVKEDAINKPWRPLPTGRISSEQTRRLMLGAIPTVLALNFTLGAWEETALLFVLTWIYNDLRGGDEIVRDVIISMAFGFYNKASLRIAIGEDTYITNQGYIWIAIISGVILTTMCIQDLRDREGDAKRGRRTIPLVLGDVFSRRWIATSVFIWSWCCTCFWGLTWSALLGPALLGGFVSFLVLQSPTSFVEDVRVWKLWCLWTAVLYTLPLIHYLKAKGPM